MNTLLAGNNSGGTSWDTCTTHTHARRKTHTILGGELQGRLNHCTSPSGLRAAVTGSSRKIWPRRFARALPNPTGIQGFDHLCVSKSRHDTQQQQKTCVMAAAVAALRHTTCADRNGRSAVGTALYPQSDPSEKTNWGNKKSQQDTSYWSESCPTHNKRGVRHYDTPFRTPQQLRYNWDPLASLAVQFFDGSIPAAASRLTDTPKHRVSVCLRNK